MPDFAVENEFGGVVAGIDEVGRGPLAGPVFAAAVILDPPRMPAWLFEKIDDSKKLAPEARERIAAALPDCAQIAVAQASVAEIDRVNILRASHLAMWRALRQLTPRPALVLIDGNLVPKRLGVKARAIVGGDGISLSIAAASIVAKVARDRLMAELARRHPHYGWEHNAGYATPEHLSALAQHGPCRHHRTSFAPVRAQHENRGYLLNLLNQND